MVGLPDLVEKAMPKTDTIGSTGISSRDREAEEKLLAECATKYSVCIMDAPPNNLRWLSVKLMEPADNQHFDPVKSHLVFGMIQYVDEKTGLLVCMVAKSTQAHAVPWIGSSWVTDGKTIKRYKFWDDRFNTVMTPKSLYKAILKSHEEAVRDNRCVKSYNVPNAN